MKAHNDNRTCPICDAAAAPRFRPFCSRRCADIDLGRWLNEDYAIPAFEPPDDWDGAVGEGE